MSKLKKPTVTLCMIVKDEEHIIHECLDSMKPYVDRFDITDTGSTDRTKEIIQEWSEKNNIPGTVYDHPWEGFGKSRTASLRKVVQTTLGSLMPMTKWLEILFTLKILVTTKPTH